MAGTRVRLVVHIMPPRPHQANPQDPESSQQSKPLRTLAVPADLDDTFAEVWRNLQSRDEAAYTDKQRGAAQYYRLQGSMQEDICLSDTLNDLGIARGSPREDLVLYMQQRDTHRDVSLAPDSILRPGGWRKRPLEVSDETAVESREGQEDMSILNRTHVGEQNVEWRDSDGFRIPKPVKRQRIERNGDQESSVLANRTADRYSTANESQAPHKTPAKAPVSSKGHGLVPSSQSSGAGPLSSPLDQQSALSVLQRMRQKRRIHEPASQMNAHQNGSSPSSTSNHRASVSPRQAARARSRSSDLQPRPDSEEVVFQNDSIEDGDDDTEQNVPSSLTRHGRAPPNAARAHASSPNQDKRPPARGWTQSEDNCLQEGLRKGLRANETREQFGLDRTVKAILHRIRLLKREASKQGDSLYRTPSNAASRGDGFNVAPDHTPAKSTRHWSPRETYVLLENMGDGYAPSEIYSRSVGLSRSEPAIRKKIAELEPKLWAVESRANDFPRDTIQVAGWTDRESIRLRRVYREGISVQDACKTLLKGFSQEAVAEKLDAYKTQMSQHQPTDEEREAEGNENTENEPFVQESSAECVDEEDSESESDGPEESGPPKDGGAEEEQFPGSRQPGFVVIHESEQNDARGSTASRHDLHLSGTAQQEASTSSGPLSERRRGKRPLSPYPMENREKSSYGRDGRADAQLTQELEQTLSSDKNRQVSGPSKRGAKRSSLLALASEQSFGSSDQGSLKSQQSIHTFLSPRIGPGINERDADSSAREIVSSSPQVNGVSTPSVRGKLPPMNGSASKFMLAKRRALGLAATRHSKPVASSPSTSVVSAPVDEGDKESSDLALSSRDSVGVSSGTSAQPTSAQADTNRGNNETVMQPLGQKVSGESSDDSDSSTDVESEAESPSREHSTDAADLNHLHRPGFESLSPNGTLRTPVQSQKLSRRTLTPQKPGAALSPTSPREVTVQSTAADGSAGTLVTLGRPHHRVKVAKGHIWNKSDEQHYAEAVKTARKPEYVNDCFNILKLNGERSVAIAGGDHEEVLRLKSKERQQRRDRRQRYGKASQSKAISSRRGAAVDDEESADEEVDAMDLEDEQPGYESESDVSVIWAERTQRGSPEFQRIGNGDHEDQGGRALKDDQEIDRMILELEDDESDGAAASDNAKDPNEHLLNGTDPADDDSDTSSEHSSTESSEESDDEEDGSDQNRSVDSQKPGAELPLSLHEPPVPQTDKSTADDDGSDSDSESDSESTSDSDGETSSGESEAGPGETTRSLSDGDTTDSEDAQPQALQVSHSHETTPKASPSQTMDSSLLSMPPPIKSHSQDSNAVLVPATAPTPAKQPAGSETQSSVRSGSFSGVFARIRSLAGNFRMDIPTVPVRSEEDSVQKPKLPFGSDDEDESSSESESDA